MVFDSIIIGSSPVSMLESIYQTEQGKKVLLLDKAHSLGGAWRVESCFDLAGVEISPHVMLPNRSAYQILRKKFDIDMVPMEPPPVYIINGKKRPLEYLNVERVTREYAGSYKYKSIAEKLIRMLAALYHAAQLSKKNYRSVILYPQGGLNNFLRRAYGKLEELGIKILLNEEVTTLRYFPDLSNGCKFELNTVKGNTYNSQSMSSSGILSLENIYLDDKCIRPYSYINQSDHLTFLVKSSESGNYGFAKIIDDSTYELVSDVSPFTPDLPEKYPGHKIITCRFQKNRIYEESRIVEYFNHLKIIGYLSSTDEFRDYYHYSAEDKVLAGYMIDRLKTVFGPDYHFIGSRELGMTDSLDEFNARWEFVDTA